MASWAEVEVAAPELAARARARFETTGLGLLATVRKDGSPRICPIEPLFALGEVWLGMMDGARKLADLRRDGRLALHAATIDKRVAEGDAKLAGRALEVTDPALFRSYQDHFRSVNGEVPEGPFPLFRVDLHELSFLAVGGDELVIDVWREGAEPFQIRRS